MDLTTRCPECGTTFSASLAQLQLRKGYIRCINCAHIFDGFDAVVSSDAAAARSMQEPSAQQDMSAPQETPAHREPSMPMPRVLRQRSEEHTSELQSLMRISYAVFCFNKTHIAKLTNQQ